MAISTVAVLGAGNGGCAAAADLTLRGYETRLYSRSPATLAPIREHGGIELLENGKGRFASPAMITSSIGAAVTGADLIVITVPALAHAFMGHSLAPFLTPHPIVHLNPGQTGGSLHFVHSLRESGYQDALQCCETVTLTYICRSVGQARVEVYRRTANLLCAAFPTRITATLLPQLAQIYPNIIPAAHVLETGLSNINAIMHPAGMVGNAAWIERHGGGLLYYRDAISPAVARIIEDVDLERLKIVRRLNLPPRSFIDIFHSAGLTSDAALETQSVFQAIQESKPNATITAPTTHDHRYMHEDIGYGLVPMASLARAFDIDTPVIDSLITLASTINRIDYRREGLTLQKMGLGHTSFDRLPQILFEGFDRGHLDK